MVVIERESGSREETIAFGQEIGRALIPGEVIGLFGDLGAGKTTLIKGIASGSTGCSECEVVSPTFVYLNIYQGALTFYHFDLYRLTEPNAFFDLGFNEFLESRGICCIEWAERADPRLTSKWSRVTLTHLGDERRNIAWERK